MINKDEVFTFKNFSVLEELYNLFQLDFKLL